jgi:hypothetical protein
MYKSIFFVLLSLCLLTACDSGGSPESQPEVDEIEVSISNRFSNHFTGDILTGHFDAKQNLDGKPVFRWLRNGVEIEGSTEQSYVLNEQDEGKKITFEVSYRTQSEEAEEQTVSDSTIILSLFSYQDIKNAFDEHYEYFVAEMHRRLAKDANGNSDTYVLYDVQTYMQNAAIFADERGDVEMLQKLLSLVSIPFEDRYLSEGQWLNNTYGYVGVEVTLTVSQYFNLLTRVLSACERHGIPTNFSDENLRIISDHINKWLARSPTYQLINDKNLFFVQSAVQFHDYLQVSKRQNRDFLVWKQYVQNYMQNVIAKKWTVEKCNYNGTQHDCWVLDKYGWYNYTFPYGDYNYSGYGSEITNASSDTDPNAMFDADGNIKQAPSGQVTGATDISHARRFNWFFETIKRFGGAFEVSISDEALEGWANNLAYQVSRGTANHPHFTVYSDGTDGWYRVGYRGRKNFGYSLGDMDIHFVASSYGLLGTYNPKIYQWMKAWENKNKSRIHGYSGYRLDYLTSMMINMRQPLK